jgi:hypothetical protein
LPENVFSAARLRGYRVVERAGLTDAVTLHLLNTIVAGRLWLPLSLIEIAFRNAVDDAISAAHPNGGDWMLAAGRSNALLDARAVRGAPSLIHVDQDGLVTDDPVADAALRASSQLSRACITRDDLVAHLTLGFWVHRSTEGLSGAQGLDVWALVARRIGHPLDDAAKLNKVMTRLLRIRNRVAHHETLLLRSKHVFNRSGEPKTGADLVASVQGALTAFLEDVDEVASVASSMAPMASTHIAAVPGLVRDDLAAFEATLIVERERLRAERDARMSRRRQVSD